MAEDAPKVPFLPDLTEAEVAEWNALKAEREPLFARLWEIQLDLFAHPGEEPRPSQEPVQLSLLEDAPEKLTLAEINARLAEIESRQDELARLSYEREEEAVRTAENPQERLSAGVIAILSGIERPLFEELRVMVGGSPETPASPSATAANLIQPFLGIAERLRLSLGKLDALLADRLAALGYDRPIPAVLMSYTSPLTRPLEPRSGRLAARLIAQEGKPGLLALPNPLEWPAPAKGHHPKREAYTEIQNLKLPPGKTKTQAGEDAQKLWLMILAQFAETGDPDFTISADGFAANLQLSGGSQEWRWRRLKAAKDCLEEVKAEYRGFAKMALTYFDLKAEAGDTISLRLSASFQAHLRSKLAHISPVSAVLLGYTGEPFRIGSAIQATAYNDDARLKGQADRLGVSTLLKLTELDGKFAELEAKKDARHWEREIRERLEGWLDALTRPVNPKLDARRFLIGWSYASRRSKGTAADPEGLEYREWAKLLIRFDLAYPPEAEDAPRLERHRKLLLAKDEARAARRERLALEGRKSPGRPRKPKPKPILAEAVQVSPAALPPPPQPEPQPEYTQEQREASLAALRLTAEKIRLEGNLRRNRETLAKRREGLEERIGTDAPDTQLYADAVQKLEAQIQADEDRLEEVSRELDAIH